MSNPRATAATILNTLGGVGQMVAPLLAPGPWQIVVGTLGRAASLIGEFVTSTGLEPDQAIEPMEGGLKAYAEERAALLRERATLAGKP